VLTQGFQLSRVNFFLVFFAVNKSRRKKISGKNQKSKKTKKNQMAKSKDM